MTSDVPVVHTADAESQLIYHIYEASKEPDNWTTVLKQFSAIFRARSCTFERHDFSTGSSHHIHTAGVAPRYRRSYNDIYSAMDPWVPQKRQHEAHGPVTTGRELVDDDDLVNTPFYNDWLRPQGLRYSLLGVVHHDSLMCWSVKLLRDVGTPDFSDGDVAHLEKLLPHLQQAFYLSRVLSDQHTMHTTAMSVLDRMHVGVAFVSPDGQVIATNQLAEEITGAADGIWIGPDGLCATNGLEQTRLRALIRRTSTSNPSQAYSGGQMSIRRELGLRPLSLWVEPMTGDGSTFENRRAGATVYIGDPERQAEPDQDWLISTFELTAAEARIAARLAIGARLADAAQGLGIGYETARTHLKRVFQKTHTDRQADLVRLIATSALHHRPPLPRTGPSSQRLAARNDESVGGRMRHAIGRS